MQIGTIIRHKESGNIGVVCPNLPGYLRCGDPKDITVQFEGSSATNELPPGEFEFVGPENPVITDPKKCGMGLGKDCCIFLTVNGAAGFECQRHGPMRWSLIFKTMTSERNPGEFYPRCMNQ